MELFMIDSVVEFVVGLPFIWNMILSTLAFIFPFTLVLLMPMYLIDYEDGEKESQHSVVEINLSNGFEEIDEHLFNKIKRSDRVTKQYNKISQTQYDLRAEYFNVNMDSLIS